MVKITYCSYCFMGVVFNFLEMLIILLLTGKSGCTFGGMVGLLFMRDVDG